MVQIVLLKHWLRGVKMALENLKNIFEQSGFGVASAPSNPPPPEEQSPDVDKTEQLFKPDSKLASKITFGNPVTTDYELGTGIFNNPDVYDEDQIKQRTFDMTKIGQDSNLGLGNFVLETLYNKNHTPNTNRIQIQYGQTIVNTGRSGIGSLGNLDIKAHSSGFRTSLLGPEPYEVNDIGSKTNSIGNNRDLIPFTAALEDTSRLAKFYTSQAGLAFIAKEQITNYAIGSSPKNNPLPRALDAGARSLLKIPNLNEVNKILIPPFTNPIQGNTGFLNFTNQFRELGSTFASIRKPFEIEYSKRHTVNLPFGFLGDNAPQSIGDPTGDSRLPIEYPTFKTPRFLGLGNGPRWRNNDKISDSGVESLFFEETDFGNTAPLEDETFDIQKGDFYVRIKDLRDNSFIYFRGYVTGITENVSPSFTSTNYIGRSEPVYMYERAERDLSFNLRVHPANIIQQDKMYEKIEKLTSLAYPEYFADRGLTRMKPPFTELYMAHIGSKSGGQFGFIKSITYTVNETGDWDALEALPRLFDIAISYQILHKKPPSLTSKFYRTSTNEDNEQSLNPFA